MAKTGLAWPTELSSMYTRWPTIVANLNTELVNNSRRLATPQLSTQHFEWSCWFVDSIQPQCLILEQVRRLGLRMMESYNQSYFPREGFQQQAKVIA